VTRQYILFFHSWKITSEPAWKSISSMQLDQRIGYHFVRIFVSSRSLYSFSDFFFTPSHNANQPFSPSQRLPFTEYVHAKFKTKFLHLKPNSSNWVQIWMVRWQTQNSVAITPQNLIKGAFIYYFIAFIIIGVCNFYKGLEHWSWHFVLEINCFSASHCEFLSKLENEISLSEHRSKSHYQSHLQN
jgi:hypothetical protein